MIAGENRSNSAEQPVRAKAALIDADSMTVLWVSGAPEASQGGPVQLEQIVPLAESMGLADAIRAVAETGVPEHLHADLVSSGRGSVTHAVSVYRMPDGKIILLAENTWRHAERSTSGNARNPRHRSR